MSRRSAPQREPTFADLVLADVADEAEDIRSGTLLDAELRASEWLGGAWMDGRLDRDGEALLVRELVAATTGRRRAEARLALDVVATVCHDLSDLVADALDGCPPSVARPAWATDPRRDPERPTRARLWSDPWNSERVHILDYEDPEPHSLVAHVTTDGGLIVNHLVVGVPDPSGPFGDEADPDDLLVERGEQDVDDARAALATALRQTDMYWPPQDAEEYVVTRALARWRTHDHDELAEWEPLPDEERRSLVEDFVGSAGPSLAHDPGVLEVLADTFVDFGEGYLENGVLGWSPGEVEHFMTDWVHRKVLLEEEVSTALPEVLRAWVVFALGRAGLPAEHVRPVTDAVEALSREYRELLDADIGSPSKALLSDLVAGGVDLEDKEAVAQAVSEYNARHAALRLLDRD